MCILQAQTGRHRLCKLRFARTGRSKQQNILRRDAYIRSFLLMMIPNIVNRLYEQRRHDIGIGHLSNSGLLRFGHIRLQHIPAFELTRRNLRHDLFLDFLVCQSLGKKFADKHLIGLIRFLFDRFGYCGENTCSRNIYLDLIRRADSVDGIIDVIAEDKRLLLCFFNQTRKISLHNILIRVPHDFGFIRNIPDFCGSFRKIRDQSQPKHRAVAPFLVIEDIRLVAFTAVIGHTGKQKLLFLFVKTRDMRHRFTLPVFGDIQFFIVAADLSQSASETDRFGVDFLRAVGFTVINPASLALVQHQCLYRRAIQRRRFSRIIVRGQTIRGRCIRKAG